MVIDIGIWNNLEMWMIYTCTHSIAVYPAVPILAAHLGVRLEGRGIAQSDLIFKYIIRIIYKNGLF